MSPEETLIPPGQTPASVQPSAGNSLVPLRPLAQSPTEQPPMEEQPIASAPSAMDVGQPTSAPTAPPQGQAPQESEQGESGMSGVEIAVHSAGFKPAAPDVDAEFDAAPPEVAPAAPAADAPADFKAATPELDRQFDLMELNKYDEQEAAQHAAGDPQGAFAHKLTRVAREQNDELTAIYKSKELSDIPATVLGIREQSSNPAKRLLNGDALVTAPGGKVVSGYGTAHLRGVLNHRLAAAPSKPAKVRAKYFNELMGTIMDPQISASQRAINFDFAQVIAGEVMLQAQASMTPEAWEKLDSEKRAEMMKKALADAGIDPSVALKAKDLAEFFKYAGAGATTAQFLDLIPVVDWLSGSDRPNDQETIRQARQAVSLGVATPFQRELAIQEEAREMVNSVRGSTVLAGSASVVKGIIPFFVGIGATKFAAAGVRKAAIVGLEKAALQATVKAGVKGLAGRAVKTGISAGGKVVGMGAGYAPMAAAESLVRAEGRHQESRASGDMESFAASWVKETARGTIDAAAAELSTPLKAVMGTAFKTAFKYGSKKLPASFVESVAKVVNPLAKLSDKTRIPLVSTTMKELGYNGPINILSNEPGKVLKAAIGIEQYHALTGHELLEQLIGFSIPGITTHAVGAARMGYGKAVEKYNQKRAKPRQIDAEKVHDFIAAAQRVSPEPATTVEKQKEVVAEVFADKEEFMSPEGLAAAQVVAPDLVDSIAKPDVQPTRKVMPGSGAEGWRFTNEDRIAVQKELRELADAQAQDAELKKASEAAREEMYEKAEARTVQIEPKAEPKAEEQSTIGRSWEAVEPNAGIVTRTVEGVLGGDKDGRLLVSRPGLIGHELISPSQLEARIKADEARAQEYRENQEKVKKQEAEDDRLDQEFADAHPHLSPFLSSHSPMHRASAQKTLEKQASVQGKFAPMYEHVERLYNEGYRAKKTPKGWVLNNESSGSYLIERDIGKTPIMYADFMQKKAPKPQAIKNMAPTPKAQYMAKRATSPTSPTLPFPPPANHLTSDTAATGGDAGQMHIAERTMRAPEDIARKDLVSAPDIIHAMKKLFDSKMYTGKMSSSKAAGEYSPTEDTITVLRQRTGDLGVITHEIFHGVDRNTDILKRMPMELQNEVRKLDYEPEKGRAFEGFAEWWRIYLTQSEAQARALAPNSSVYFEAWLNKEQNRNVREAVQATKALMYKYSVKQGARERVVASVKTKEGGIIPDIKQIVKAKSAAEIAKDTADAIYERLFDSKLRMAQFDKLTRTKALVDSGSLMSKEIADFYRGGEQAVAHQWLMHGVDTFAGEGKDLTVVKSKSGATILEVVRGLSDDARTDFAAYLVADHLTEAMPKEGYAAAGITLQDAQRVARDMEGKYPDFVRRAKEYRQYMHDLVDSIVDAGLLSPQNGQKIKGRYKKFTSMQREIQMEERLLKHYAGGGSSSAWRARSEKGSGENIIDPLQVAAAETLRVVSKIQNGMAWHRIIQQYKASVKAGNVEHLGSWIHELPDSWKEEQVSTERVVEELIKSGVDEGAFDAIKTKRTVDGVEVVTYDPGMLSYWRKDYGAYKDNYNVHVVHDVSGQNKPPVNYAVNKTLLDAVNDTNLWSVGKALNIQDQSKPAQVIFKVSAIPFEVGTKVTRLGSTTLNIARTGLNAFEAFCAYITGSEKLGLSVAQAAWRPFARIPAVFGAEARDVLGMEQVDPYYIVAERFGLKSSTLLGGDLTQSTNALLAKMQTEGDLSARAKQVLTSPRLLGGKAISTVGAAMSASEMITRTAILKRAFEMNGVSEKELSAMLANGKMPPFEVVVRSMNLAKDMAINFSRKGTTGGAGSKAYAFYSARLAVIDQMARTLVDLRKGGEWNPQKLATLAPLLGYTAALATAYWFMRKDDDDYKQMPGYAKMIGPTITDGEGNPMMQIPLGDGIIPTMWRSVEAALNAVADGDHGEAAKAALERTTQSFVPPGFPDATAGADAWMNMVPTVAKPVVSVTANLDPLSKQPIVREHEKHPRLPEFEVNARTTDASRAFGSTMFGKAIGASPIKTDYLMNSWTGGEFSRFLGVNASASRALIPFMAPGWQAKAAREFYARKQELDDARVSEKNGGPERTEAKKGADYRLDHYADVMAVLRKKQIPLRGYDEKFVYDKFLTGTAMIANGDAPLARYPNPFLLDSGLPQDARDEINDLVVKKIRTAIKPAPDAHGGAGGKKVKKDLRPMVERAESKEAWQIHHDAAVKILQESGLSREELRDMWLDARKDGEKLTPTDALNIRKIMSLEIPQK